MIDRAEAVAFAATLESLRDGSALPVRRPSYSEPTFWSRPLNQTAIVVMPPDPNWVTLVDLLAPTQYLTRITEYAVATAQANTVPGVEFRLLQNGSPLTNVTLPAGVEVCKGATWPLVLRKIDLIATETLSVGIQARNLGLLPFTVLAGFWGWNYNTIEIELGRTQGITDA